MEDPLWDKLEEDGWPDEVETFWDELDDAEGREEVDAF